MLVPQDVVDLRAVPVEDVRGDMTLVDGVVGQGVQRDAVLDLGQDDLRRSGLGPCGENFTPVSLDGRRCGEFLEIGERLGELAVQETLHQGDGVAAGVAPTRIHVPEITPLVVEVVDVERRRPLITERGEIHVPPGVVRPVAQIGENRRHRCLAEKLDLLRRVRPMR